MLARLFDAKIDVTYILCDNQSCINMTENLVFHDKSNHIEVRYHFIRDMVSERLYKAQVCSYRGTSDRCVN